MVSFGLIKNGLGLGFKGFGLFWGISNRFLCNWVCDGGTCSGEQTGACTFLFLLVAIIFVVCGYAIIMLPKKKKEKVKELVETEIK